MRGWEEGHSQWRKNNFWLSLEGRWSQEGKWGVIELLGGLRSDSLGFGTPCNHSLQRAEGSGIAAE